MFDQDCCLILSLAELTVGEKSLDVEMTACLLVENDMWDHVKYANTILDYVDGVETLSQDVKNEYKGRALFHRSWAFYNLTFWYGNIPLVTTLPTGPKKNYISCPQSEVVKKIVEDLKQAVEWVPSQNEMNQWGSINKEACRHLYIKALLADGQFREAENDNEGAECVPIRVSGKPVRKHSRNRGYTPCLPPRSCFQDDEDPR